MLQILPPFIWWKLGLKPHLYHYFRLLKWQMLAAKSIALREVTFCKNHLEGLPCPPFFFPDDVKPNRPEESRPEFSARSPQQTQRPEHGCWSEPVKSVARHDMEVLPLKFGKNSARLATPKKTMRFESLQIHPQKRISMNWCLFQPSSMLETPWLHRKFPTSN